MPTTIPSDDSPTTTVVKDDLRLFVENLPDDVTWEEVQYQVYVRRAIDEGLDDSRAGRTVPHDEVRRLFGSPRS